MRKWNENQNVEIDIKFKKREKGEVDSPTARPKSVEF